MPPGIFAHKDDDKQAGMSNRFYWVPPTDRDRVVAYKNGEEEGIMNLIDETGKCCGGGCGCNKGFEAVDIAREDTESQCDVLRKEIAVLRRDTKMFRQALVRLVGSDERDELTSMCGAITMSFLNDQMSAEQFEDMHGAIQVLIATSGVHDYGD